MNKIEFIGAPAIGKSTVLQEVIGLRNREDKWLTSKEARIRIVENMECKKIGMLGSVQFCLKHNMVKRLNDLMASVIIASYEKDIFEKMQGKYNDLAYTFLYNFPSDENLNAIQRFKRLGYYYELLFKEIMTLEYFQTKELIIYEEGIIQNNSAFENESTAKILFDKYSDREKNVIPTGVIYCHLDDAIYLRRCRNRINTTNEMFFDPSINDERLAELCRRKQNNIENKNNVLKKYNIPVLEIDMNNSEKENAKLVYGFIMKFC
jgi:hypothetical protein